MGEGCLRGDRRQGAVVDDDRGIRDEFARVTRCLQQAVSTSSSQGQDEAQQNNQGGNDHRNSAIAPRSTTRNRDGMNPNPGSLGTQISRKPDHMVSLNEDGQPTAS